MEPPVSQAEPFLPPMAPDPSKPDPAQAPKSSAKRTLVVWVVFIAMLIAVYQFTSHSPRPALSECSPDYTWMWTGIGATVAALVLLFGWMRWHWTRNTAFTRDQEPATLALISGDWAEAAQGFGALIDTYRGHGGQLVASYQRAWARLRQGDLDGAITDAIASEKGAGMFTRDVRTRGAVLLAHLYALRGDTESAAHWLGEARVRIATLGDRIYVGAQLRVAEVTLACRREQYGEALAMLERDQAKIDAMLQITLAVESWVLRAFALSQLQSARTVGTLEPVLVLLRARPRGSFDYLAVAWPALRDFLVAHELHALDRDNLSAS